MRKWDWLTIGINSVIAVMLVFVLWIIYYGYQHPSPCNNPQVACHDVQTFGVTGYTSDGKMVYGMVTYRAPNETKR